MWHTGPWNEIQNEFQAHWSLLIIWSLNVLCVIWPSALVVLSEAESCVNYGRPSQTTGKNQHEALTVTTTQRSPKNSVFLLHTSVLKECLEQRLHFNVHTQQQRSSHVRRPWLVTLGVMLTPNYSVVLSRQRSVWKASVYWEVPHVFDELHGHKAALFQTG